MKSKETKSYRLCYVEGSDRYSLKLWFTNDFEHQWGDDWNDVPYEHNAGEPYEHYLVEDEQIPNTHKCCYIEAAPNVDITTPCSGYLDSPYSVEQINNRITPWLILKDRYENDTYVFARDTYFSVIKKLKELGCTVYTVNERKKKEE